MMESLVVHHTRDVHADTLVPDAHQDTFSKTILGFWIYLMTDCILFAALFSTYAVLHDNTFGGPSSKELFSLPMAFVETIILLFSSVFSGFGMLSALKNRKQGVIGWFMAAFLLGASFVAMEFHEFKHLIESGNGWQKSAFLSSFFTLVGTHGLHVSVGLFWMCVMMVQVFVWGITTMTFRRLALLSMFWHFLDVVWIFIFTCVYLLGVI